MVEGEEKERVRGASAGGERRRHSVRVSRVDSEAKKESNSWSLRDFLG